MTSLHLHIKQTTNQTFKLHPKPLKPGCQRREMSDMDETPFGVRRRASGLRWFYTTQGNTSKIVGRQINKFCIFYNKTQIFMSIFFHHLVIQLNNYSTGIILCHICLVSLLNHAYEYEYLFCNQVCLVLFPVWDTFSNQYILVPDWAIKFQVKCFQLGKDTFFKCPWQPERERERDWESEFMSKSVS